MNKALAITAKPIPYIKDFRRLFEKTASTAKGDQTRAGSIPACILLQQLEFYSSNYKNGFFKFLSPCDNPAYREGDSWTEELGYTEGEFRSAFKEIGTVWKSKKAFKEAKDKFQGRFYASYTDRIKGLTYYFRNHELLDEKITEILSDPMARNQTFPSSVNDHSQVTEVRSGEFHYSENTTENTTKNIKRRELRSTASADTPHNLGNFNNSSRSTEECADAFTFGNVTDSPRSMVFGETLALLTSQGMTESAARSFLGGLRKNYEDLSIVLAGRAAAQHEAVEARAYIVSVLKDQQEKQKNNENFKSKGARKNNAEILDEWASYIAQL